jgi:hypothetical protein
MTLDQNKPGDNEFERLKLLYEENAAQFRYFLTWRQLLLGGYFATVAALALGFKWALTEQAILLFLFPLTGAGLSVLFWMLEVRNRELYQLTSEVGSQLEEQLDRRTVGHFRAYASLQNKNWPHSRTLATFYLGCGLLMFLLTVALLY